MRTMARQRKGRRRRRKPPIMSHDSLSEVFARLPVKSLLRFRCVCKAWCSVINDPIFATFHVSTFRNNLENAYALFSGYKKRDCKWVLRHSNTLAEAWVGPRIPFGYKEKGCVNGVMLLMDLQLDPNSMFLLNLSIKKFVKLPECKARWCFSGVQQVNLVFDRSNNDYKVVAISSTWHECSSLYAEVYSHKTACWKSISGAPNLRHYGHPVFINESAHWIAQDIRWKVREPRGLHIVAFRAAKEMFSFVPLPILTEERFPSSQLTIVGGCLAFLAVFEKHSDLWVMEEYGVAISWNKRCKIDASVVFPRRDSFIVNRNDELLFATKDDGVKSFDIKTELLKDAENTYNVLNDFKDTYVESLVLLLEGSDMSLMPEKRIKGKRNA